MADIDFTPYETPKAAPGGQPPSLSFGGKYNEQTRQWESAPPLQPGATPAPPANAAPAPDIDFSKFEQPPPQEDAWQQGLSQVGEEIKRPFQSVADQMSDILDAAKTGDWEGLQKKYPPNHNLWQTLKQTYGGMIPTPDIERDAQGNINWPKTIGGTTGRLALLAAPMLEGAAEAGYASEGAATPKPTPATPSVGWQVMKAIFPDLIGAASPRASHILNLFRKGAAVLDRAIAAADEVRGAAAPEAPAPPEPTPPGPPPDQFPFTQRPGGPIAGEAAPATGTPSGPAPVTSATRPEAAAPQVAPRAAGSPPSESPVAPPEAAPTVSEEPAPTPQELQDQLSEAIKGGDKGEIRDAWAEVRREHWRQSREANPDWEDEQHKAVVQGRVKALDDAMKATAAEEAKAATRTVTSPYGEQVEVPAPEAGQPDKWAEVKDALSGKQNRIVTQEQFEQARKDFMESISGSKMGIGDIPKALKATYQKGMFHFERLTKAGIATYDVWAKAMQKEPGANSVSEDDLKKVWSKVSQSADFDKVTSTRWPRAKSASEDPTGGDLLADRAALDSNPKFLSDISDTVQGKRPPREPLRDDTNSDGDPRFETDKDFAKAHRQWKRDMTPYAGFKAPKDIANDPTKVADAFTDHSMLNLRKVWDMVPPHLQKLWAQWYDTGRSKSLALADKYGLSNEQADGAIATQSPQKDWDQNISLTERIADINHTQQDAPITPEMIAKGKALGKESSAIRKMMRSKVLEGKTYSELDTSGKSLWARLYDETYGDPRFKRYDSVGNDLGWAKNEDGTDTKIAWPSVKTTAKTISILEDGSLANIHAQLGWMHKVRNFFNNLLAPDHPNGYYTNDTHQVAAALGRPLGGSSIEVEHNFGSGGAPKSEVNGLKGTYSLYVDAGQRVAADVGVLPRQFQSVTWEAIRKIFPDTFKTEANQNIIDGLWNKYTKGQLTHEQVWDGIFKARKDAGLDVETNGVPKEFTETEKQYKTRIARERAGQ